MLKLDGFPVSNQTHLVKLALLEKGLPFEDVLALPEPTPDLLAKSPRGKVPVPGTPRGFINRTTNVAQLVRQWGVNTGTA